MAFPALRVLSMGSTAVVRATRLPVALSLDRRLPQALLAPLCGARVCTHAPVQPSPAAMPRLPGGVVRGLQASLLGRPLSLPRGIRRASVTPFRLSALSKRRDRETRRHLRAHAGREIDYERDVSSRFVQNRRAAGTVLGKGDPTRRPLEQRAELSPCPGASPRLTAHSTPSSSAGRGSLHGALLPRPRAVFSSVLRDFLLASPGPPDREGRRALCLCAPCGSLHLLPGAPQHFGYLAVCCGLRAPLPPQTAPASARRLLLLVRAAPGARSRLLPPERPRPSVCVCAC